MGAAGTQQIANAQGLGPKASETRAIRLRSRVTHVQIGSTPSAAMSAAAASGRHGHVIAIVAQSHGVELPAAAAGHFAQRAGSPPCGGESSASNNGWPALIRCWSPVGSMSMP